MGTQNVREALSDPLVWTPLRATAVTADEAVTDAAVKGNTFDSVTPFVDIIFWGTLDATNTFNVTIVEVDEVEGSLLAHVVKQAFKDGSTTVLLDQDCVIPMIAARGKVGVLFDAEDNSASVKCSIRSA